MSESGQNMTANDTDTSNIYRGDMPEMGRGDIVKFTGEKNLGGRGDATRQFTTYAWKVRNGYQIAVEDPTGDYEFDEVTDQWRPNTLFYQQYEAVDSSDFPKVTDPTKEC